MNPYECVKLLYVALAIWVVGIPMVIFFIGGIYHWWRERRK